MQFDRKITISAGSSRRAMVWQAQTLLISELWAKLQTPARGTEPLAEYLNMKKAQQDDLKDVGGFMAGTLSGPRRKANNVTGRDVITLDLDNIPPGGTEDVLRRVEGLSCGYCIYSTRKHSPAAPRLRVLLPLDRTASADEYEPIARKMAEHIGLELCDPTTFEVSRLMYWPSCCSDSQYIYVWKDKPLLSVKGLLGQYEDWRDCTLWPQVPGSQNLPTKLAVKQGDPEAKNGVVGAFCRTYDIYRAMCELATQDPDVSALMSQERYQEAVKDFEGVEATNDAEPANWMDRLEINSQTGLPKATIDNVWIILENDPLLKGKFALNQFAGRGEVLDALPWNASTKRRLWDDNDNNGLYWYMEKVHHITGNGKIDGALSLHTTQHAFNEVQDYLQSLKWDGVPRLDTLFIDYLGAEDSPYTRAVTRKAFTAAVTRAMVPGSKYDNMLILAGPQGIGKSTLLDKMSRGWFNDSIRTFEGKEASELLQGVWLVEIGELDAFRKTDVACIKQFLSLRSDRFRAAYGRHVKELPRCCVFFGTTNTSDYLRDRTGNRRFWPVDVGLAPAAKSVWTDLPGEIDQLWAEAMVRWQTGEPLFLKGEIEAAAKEAQEAHREVNTREGIILDFLERPVPEDWQNWPLDRRRMFWGGAVQGDVKLVPRDRVCALEVWCEALDGKQRDMRYSDTAEINSIIEASALWERARGSLRFGYCGKQRGFQKVRL